MTRREFAAAPFLLTQSKAAPPRPNVVMFMTDDHGAWATGAYGCKDIRTPNIDQLAAAGARFTRAFACTPVCSPSRMTYITGKIPSRHNVQDWLRPEDSFGSAAHRYLQGHQTYSEVLAANGYTLGMCGKWHMGEDEKTQAGFSYWATIPGGGGPYKDPEFVHNGSTEKRQGFKTDLTTDYAIDFLEKQKKGNPFYLLVPHYAPHTPFDFQPEEDRQHYTSSSFPCFPGAAIHPWQNRGLRNHHGNNASKLAYSALISGVDRSVGRILKKLEDMGVRGDTLVVFTADQGWNAGHHGVWGKGNGTWPFNMYEESTRVPMIWNHPGRVPAGITSTGLVSSYDYFPTILDYLGVRASADPSRAGRSYARLVRGETPAWRDRLYFEYSNVRAVRTETMKYVERADNFPAELYDLENDPGETRNLISDAGAARKRETLRADLARFFEKAGAPPLPEWRKTVRQNLTTYTN